MIQMIEAVADRYIKKYKIWQNRRLYISECQQTSIYNTRKCKQSVYIDLETFKVVCYTECAEQSTAWCKNENDRVVDALQSLARLLRIVAKGGRVVVDSIEVVMHNALLDAEPVKGYYLQWKNVRVAINRFGKLADRNRQFVIPFSGTKGNAPRGFMPLSEAGYSALVKMAKDGSYMLQPGDNAPDFDALADYLTKNN